ncbi:MAG: hypothetical protein ACFFD4_33780, partial [Candidatus Odinarchaeota archaeon]
LNGTKSTEVNNFVVRVREFKDQLPDTSLFNYTVMGHNIEDYYVWSWLNCSSCGKKLDQDDGDHWFGLETRIECTNYGNELNYHHGEKLFRNMKKARFWAKKLEGATVSVDEEKNKIICPCGMEYPVDTVHEKCIRCGMTLRS